MTPCVKRLGGEKMVNTDKLKGKFTEKRKSYAEAAKLLNCSKSTINNKLNGRAEIDCTEAVLLSRFLSLTTEESVEIFLPNL